MESGTRPTAPGRGSFQASSSSQRPPGVGKLMLHMIGDDAPRFSPEELMSVFPLCYGIAPIPRTPRTPIFVLFDSPEVALQVYMLLEQGVGFRERHVCVTAGDQRLKVLPPLNAEGRSTRPSQRPLHSNRRMCPFSEAAFIEQTISALREYGSDPRYMDDFDFLDTLLPSFDGDDGDDGDDDSYEWSEWDSDNDGYSEEGSISDHENSKDSPTKNLAIRGDVDCPICLSESVPGFRCFTELHGFCCDGCHKDVKGYAIKKCPICQQVNTFPK